MYDKYYWKIVFFAMIETYGMGQGIKSKYKILLIIAMKNLVYENRDYKNYLQVIFYSAYYFLND